MAVPWLAVGKLVLANLDTVIGVVKPVFTRKKVEGLPNEADLLNQQIAELQAAASGNAEQITQLAAQMKEVVAALEQAAASAASERARLRRLCFAAIAISIASIIVAVALLASDARAETIAHAKYADPVERYGHFALGRPHEYARLTATTDAGRNLAFQLPESEVFEDLEPRLVRLAQGEPEEILTIVSGRENGARLVLFRLSGARLEIGAESAAIGTPNRWLNPVGVADLEGDGRAEIAAVTTPHIGGTLRVYRRSGDKLAEIAALSGFSNHVYGSPELRLSTPVSIDGRMRLLVPDATRLRLRVIALEGGRLFEVARCALAAPVTGAIVAVSPATVSVGLPSGRQEIVLKHDCPASRGPGVAGL